MSDNATRDDGLARWKRCFLIAIVAAQGLRVLDGLVDVPDVWSRRGQYLLAVPLLLSAVVIVTTWLRRWGNRQ